MRVDESTGSPPTLGTVGSPNQATSYSYSALDNLTRVTQGSQSRTFVYDSLSRLTSATNPESGTIAYTYDNNGNLTERTDARGVEATYSYDALNRLTGRSYSYTGTDTAVSLETTQVDYDYDNCGAYSEGRLCSVTAKKGTAVVSTTAYANYDALGRVGKSTQTTGNQDYTMRYGYDRAGNLISQTYPSGKVVETAYDEVGRVAGVKRQGGSWYAGAAAGATGAIGYEPHGGIRQFRLGNLLWEQRRYNARLQPTQIGLGTVEATGDTLVATATGTVPTAGLLLLNYSYGTTANNGNVVSQQIQVGDSLDQTQTYTYDKLNRLKTAAETGSGTGWSQTYSYDRYGNRAVTGADSYLPMTDQALTPRALTSFNASSNRLNGLVAYDGAGNLTQDWAGRNFKYDGDNRMVDFRFTAGGALTHVKYHYDGEGRRIRKEVVGGRTTTYVYNAGGQLVAEYAGTVPPALRYLTPDHLGSTRVVTAQDQAQDQGVLTRHDYLPFGQEIEPSRGNRTTVSGYTADLTDGPAQKFTGKERDTESGLDYFGARYFGGAGGRFTSVDPENAGADPADPQSWNGYSYVLNMPLNLVDPTGEQWVPAEGGTYDWNAFSDELRRSELQPVLCCHPSGANGADQRKAERDVAETNVDLPWYIDALDIGIDVVSGVLIGVDIVLAGPTGEGIGPAILLQTGKKAVKKGLLKKLKTGASKAERHGDAGRQLSKAKKRIQELEKKLQTTPGRAARRQIRNRINNLKKDAQRANKGETHHRR